MKTPYRATSVEAADYAWLDLPRRQRNGIVAQMSEVNPSSSECAFCRIAAGSLPHHIVDEDDDWIAFLNIAPATPGHTLVVPKQHAEFLWDLTPEIAASLGVGLQRVARRLEDRLKPAGLTLFQSNRSAGWQTVFHTHFHLVPRSEGDQLVPSWTKRDGDPNELAVIAGKLT